MRNLKPTYKNIVRSLSLERNTGFNYGRSLISLVASMDYDREIDMSEIYNYIIKDFPGRYDSHLLFRETPLCLMCRSFNSNIKDMLNLDVVTRLTKKHIDFTKTNEGYTEIGSCAFGVHFESCGSFSSGTYIADDVQYIRYEATARLNSTCCPPPRVMLKNILHKVACKSTECFLASRKYDCEYLFNCMLNSINHERNKKAFDSFNGISSQSFSILNDEDNVIGHICISPCLLFRGETNYATNPKIYTKNKRKVTRFKFSVPLRITADISIYEPVSFMYDDANSIHLADIGLYLPEVSELKADIDIAFGTAKTHIKRQIF